MAIREPQLLSEEDIKRYAGRWVAIKDGKVVADSDSPESVVEQLRRDGVEPDIVRQLPPGDEPQVWIL
jgi:uncharacterized protein (DUF427 family)